MRFKIKHMILPVFSFLSVYSLAQTPCEKVYSASEIDMPPEMPLTMPQFAKFIETAIYPVLQEEVDKNKNIIPRLNMLFTISDKGEITTVEFPLLEASAETHRKLAEAFMKMGAWKPGTINKIPVCSQFLERIACIKWQ